MEKKNVFCQNCGERINAEETYCPKCGKKVGEEEEKKQPSNNQNKKMPVWAIIVIVILAIVVLGAVLDDEDSPTETGAPQNEGIIEEENPADNENVQQQPQENIEQKYKIGSTVTYEGVNYTVTKVKYSNGTEWDTPAKGKEYVIVTIQIENKSDEKISYNTYDWKMRNSQGQEEDGAFTTIDNDTNLGSGDLTPNGKKEGTLVFEEPKNDKSLKLLYFGHILSDEEGFEIILK